MIDRLRIWLFPAAIACFIALCTAASFAPRADAQIGFPFPGPGRAATGSRCAGTSYTTTGVGWAGSTKLARGAALTGITSTKTGTVSFWINMTGSSDGTNYDFFTSQGGFVRLHRNTSNQIRFLGRNAGSTNIIDLNSTSTVLAASGWHTVLISYDLAASAAKMYVDDTDVTNAATVTNDTVAYATATDWWQGTDTGGAAQFVGQLSDFWFSNSYLDFTNSANRAKYETAGCPVNLGSTGQTPTGSSPLIFNKGTSTTYGQSNLGTGGGFTITGSLTNSATSPSD